MSDTSEGEKRAPARDSASKPLGLIEVLRRVHDGRLSVDEAVRILRPPDRSAPDEPRS